MTAVLARISPYDPVAGMMVTLAVSSVDDARVTSLDGVVWAPLLVDPGEITVQLVNPRLGGRLAPAQGAMVIDTRNFPLAGRYIWADARVELYAAQPGTPWPWPLVFDGLVAEAQLAQRRLRLAIRSYDAWLEQPLLATYAGTGGLEGPSELRGRPKPLAIGAPRFCEPVLFDPASNIYQVHGYGRIRAVTTVFERLVRFGVSAGDHPTLAALQAATVPAGSWATCLAQGLVRLGAPAVGTIALHVEGDDGGADGWVRRAGAIVRRLAALRGLGTALLDLTNLAALDAALPHNLSRYYNEQTTMGDAIAELAAALGAAAGIGLRGKLQILRPSTSAPVLTLAVDGSREPQTSVCTLLGTSAPWWRLEMGYATSWRVHSADETAYSGEIGTNAGAQPWAQVTGPGKPQDNATRTDARGAWGQPVAYQPGDMVHYQGQGYYCEVAHTSSPSITPLDTTRWTPLTAISAGGRASVAIGAIGTSAVLSRVFANGETQTVRAQVRNHNQGTTTCTLTVKIQQRLGTAGTWSDITSVVSDTSDVATLVNVTTTVTNSSGGDRVQEYRAISTLAPTAGNVDTAVSFLLIEA